MFNRGKHYQCWQLACSKEERSEVIKFMRCISSAGCMRHVLFCSSAKPQFFFTYVICGSNCGLLNISEYINAFLLENRKFPAVHALLLVI